MSAYGPFAPKVRSLLTDHIREDREAIAPMLEEVELAMDAAMESGIGLLPDGQSTIFDLIERVWELLRHLDELETT